MKQDFLDNLDSGWGDAISNTYEEASKLTLTDTKLNINIILKNDPEEETVLGNNYFEVYISKDNKFKVEFKISYFSSGPIANLLFSVRVCSLPHKRGCYVTGDSISVSTTTPQNNNIINYLNKNQSDLNIDYEFLDNFLLRTKTNQIGRAHV